MLFLLPIFSGVHNLATLLGSLYGLCFLAEGIVYDKLSFNAKKYTAFLLFVISLALILGSIYVMNRGKDTAKNQKVLIVLGCRVKGDVASVALEKRAESAYFYLLKNPNSVAILSGGQGKDENISEAACLKKLLTDRGILANRLFCEELSTSTDENIRFSKKIIDENGFDTNVAIVTSEYHQLRSKHICEKNGLKFASISSKTEPLYLPTFLVRELMALINEKIK
ncbi:MAG: YdcF family protein [Eubacteriales bacterium]|nr:YdcF family protein [Eubacteriales bacterium]